MSGSAHPHGITIEPCSGRVRAMCRGTIVADSDRALVLLEGSLPAVTYFPRDDVNMNLLQRTTYSTHCPFKGDASYYSIRVGDTIVDNAVWTYETPIQAVESIKGYLAFDRAQVEVKADTP